MAQPDATQQDPSRSESVTPTVPVPPAVVAPRSLAAGGSRSSCPTCGQAGQSAVVTNAGSYVYAIGRIEPRFPRPSVEKEFAQVVGRAETMGLTDRQSVHKVLTQRQNRYLARQLCWVITIEGMETYFLLPRDAADFDLLVESLRPAPTPMDLDVVIGVLGPVAPPDMCNGLTIPIVAFDTIFSFDRDSLLKAIPKPKEMPAEQFGRAAAELFDRIMQIADNKGTADEHRALNYLAVRYPAIYVTAAEEFAHNASLSSVYTTASRLSGVRKVVDVIFSYVNRSTDVTEKFFVRVDVTEEFPYLVTKLSPYHDR